MDVNTFCVYSNVVHNVLRLPSQLTQELQSPSLSRPVHLALLANLQYLRLVEKNPLTFTGRRVLAAIIMQRKQKKPKKDNYKVVSLAIGETL